MNYIIIIRKEYWFIMNNRLSTNNDNIDVNNI